MSFHLILKRIKKNYGNDSITLLLLLLLEDQLNTCIQTTNVVIQAKQFTENLFVKTFAITNPIEDKKSFK